MDVLAQSRLLPFEDVVWSRCEEQRVELRGWKGDLAPLSDSPS